MSNRKLLCTMVVAMLCWASADAIWAQTGKPATAADVSRLPERKQTQLGLYVTAAQAYDMWKAAPKEVKIIDVRTPEEYAFVGHPEMAWNIPWAFVTYLRSNGKTEYHVKMNENFVSEVIGIAGPNDILLVTCRSGDRSARAVNDLAAAGLTKAYTITDGVEGDKVEDPESVFFGKRMKNGWKNSAPWVYGFDPEKIILEEGTSKSSE
jgi:rhodanese-related sulfurtransferase